MIKFCAVITLSYEDHRPFSETTRGGRGSKCDALHPPAVPDPWGHFGRRQRRPGRSHARVRPWRGWIHPLPPRVVPAGTGCRGTRRTVLVLTVFCHYYCTSLVFNAKSFRLNSYDGTSACSPRNIQRQMNETTCTYVSHPMVSHGVHQTIPPPWRLGSVALHTKLTISQ
jgi:hypothetical protein